MDRKQLADELKLRFLEEIRAEKSSELDKWEKKELEHAESILISSLSSVELREKMLEDIENPDSRYTIISTFDEKTMEKYIDSIKEKDLMVGLLIKTGKSDEYKQKFLEDIEDDWIKALFISSFESDELKQIYLDGIESTSSRAIIIKEIKDDEIKSELAQKLGDIFFTTEIMATVEDDKLKREFLYTKLVPGNFFARELDSYCCDLVMSMGNYKDKERFSNMMSRSHKARVIASITGEEKDFPVEKMEYLSQKREDIHIKEEEASKRVKLLEKIEKLRSIIAEQEQEIAIGTEEKDGGEIGDNE